MSERRVVCAAIRAANGELVLGIRHYSVDMRVQLALRVDEGRPFANRLDEDQGFVDQHGVFMDRFEAFEVADRAGQIIRPEACGTGLRDGVVAAKLYSEGLY